MAETSDYSPGDWAGHDFTAARKAYDATAGRSYADPVKASLTAADVVPVTLTTNSTHPLIVICDMTGSMGQWPGIIFSKLPYLDIEGKQYLGEDMEISFGAVGDAVMLDKQPLQVRPFGKGTALKAHLEALIKQGGGGDTSESYELAALYYARNVSFPNAVIKPILIFIGDEGLHDFVEKAHAATHHIHVTRRMETKEIMAELLAKYAVYIVRKPYDELQEPIIHKQWADLLGSDHIAMLQAPERIVDVIFGILARETNRVEYFRGELEGRQSKDQVDTVYRSLRTVHTTTGSPPAKPLPKGRSVMHLPDAPAAKGLLGGGKKGGSS